MVFSSIDFLFLFLPIVLLLVLVSRGVLRNYILIVASLIFYAIGEKVFVLIMLASIVMNYCFAILIDSWKSNKNRVSIILALSVFSNLLLLLVFKYLNFIVRNLNLPLTLFNLSVSVPEIHLPIGISFFTFQAMSYVIDVYRQDVESQKKVSSIFLYISMFPQLIAGPIVRYIDIEKQLDERRITLADFESGIVRFITGLAKKVLIANNMALVADGVFNSQVEHLSTGYAWLGLIAYTLQIYFDFSGYSDMAIGLGKMFGFRFLENFNYPYISKSVKEFWRRWHISLSTWFRDYLYIPLGGNRNGRYRTYFNLFLVFFLTGLWHGAEWTFIIWGLYHGFFLVIERAGFDRLIKRSGIGFIYTLFIVMIGWVFFRAPDIGYAFDFIILLFSFNSNYFVNYNALRYINYEFLIYLFAGIIFSAPVVPVIFSKIRSIPSSVFYNKILVYSNTIILFLMSIIHLAKGSYNPFIYFRF